MNSGGQFALPECVVRFLGGLGVEHEPDLVCVICVFSVFFSQNFSIDAQLRPLSFRSALCLSFFLSSSLSVEIFFPIVV